MNITVIGLGYVGAVTSTCLAKDGHQVLGIDLDNKKIELLRRGQSPIIEEGIDEITRIAVESGRLKVGSALEQDAVNADVVFVCVGTPSASNGSQDLSALRRVCEQIGSHLRSTSETPAIIIRSTVPPGTTDGILKPILEQASGKVAGTDFGLGFQPEFLREGSSVSDFDNPPMTIVSGDEQAVTKISDLFKNFPCEIYETDTKTAELLKVACNTFHALKVNFANEIGRLGRSLDMDSRHVMELLCKDTQLNISSAYLRPGFAFGGSCLPKDLRALLYVAKSLDVDIPMLQSIIPSNDIHIDSVANLIMEHPKSNRTVGLVGLSFKQGTDDLRESPMVSLAERLIGKGYELKIYDPAVTSALLIGANRRFIETTIPHFEKLMSNSLESTLSDSSTVVVAHSHSGLEKRLSKLDPSVHIVDLVGLSDLQHPAVSGVAW